jgi:hypothetical protein
VHHQTLSGAPSDNPVCQAELEFGCTKPRLLHFFSSLVFSVSSTYTKHVSTQNNVISLETYCRRFDPGGSLDRRVNCRRVSQPRWVGARRSTKGGKETGKKGKPATFVLSCAQVGCACSRGLQASAWERARDFARRLVLPRVRPSRTRALDLPFIGVRRGPRCTMGDVAVC